MSNSTKLFLSPVKEAVTLQQHIYAGHTLTSRGHLDRYVLGNTSPPRLCADFELLIPTLSCVYRSNHNNASKAGVCYYCTQRYLVQLLAEVSPGRISKLGGHAGVVHDVLRGAPFCLKLQSAGRKYQVQSKWTTKEKCRARERRGATWEAVNGRWSPKWR